MPDREWEPHFIYTLVLKSNHQKKSRRGRFIQAVEGGVILIHYIHAILYQMPETLRRKEWSSLGGIDCEFDTGLKHGE